MFYEVFIRPTQGTGLTPESSFSMDEYDKLDLVDESLSALFADPRIRNLADGTGRVTEETLNFECGSLRVDKVEYDYLRDIFNNTLSDVLLFSPGSNPATIEIIGMRLHVKLLSTSGEECMIQISGTLKIAPENADSRVIVSASWPQEESDLLVITVIDSSGAPVAGAVVTDSVVFGPIETDKDGVAMGLIYISESAMIETTKAGLTFPIQVLTVPGKGDIIEITIQAEEA